MKYVECSLKSQDNSTQAVSVTPELNGRLHLFSVHSGGEDLGKSKGGELKMQKVQG